LAQLSQKKRIVIRVKTAVRIEPYREPKNKVKELQMKKVLVSSFVVALVLVFGIGSVLAADTKRDRKRDGSCRSTYSIESRELTLASDRKKDRKRDGSCRSFLNAADEDSLTIAADQKRDRKRDGSCRG
jgi:hypothetical protein